MDALQLLTWSLILYLFASLASLFLLGLDRLAIKLSGITSLVGGVIGIISGITQLHAGVTLVAHFATPFDFADLTLRMDSLSAFMVLVISLLVVVCSLYSLTYMREYEGKGAAAMGFFMNLFIASMVALLVMDNAFWFIVLFEMMSLSSWFLVIARQDKMGALAKRMPWTAAACLIGCLAISALPPLNGFISEWYTWQSLFSLSRVEAVALQLAGPIAMVMLAVTGGLAVMCFVKMYGITFCGAPRSTHAEEAQEVPNTMIVAMLLLAALCVLIALSASWLAPKIMHIAHAFTDTPPVTVASGIALVPGTFHTRVTPSLLLLLLLAMPLLPGLYWLWCRSRRAAFRRTGDAWACGYSWENAMAPSGNGVMQPLRVVFSALFRLRQQLDPTLRLNKGLAHVTARLRAQNPSGMSG